MILMPYFEINLMIATVSAPAMLINLRKKPDLTFAGIYHTGIAGRNFWQQYFLYSKNT
ncbi:hypothetical protein [Fischerella sp.]|uniref:hypothetical protein n=1 Tax=Fischerella sp. TaxID=1191 RepID=UPI0025C1FB63|nr:hypothetical protein [Fischerella sp.]